MPATSQLGQILRARASRRSAPLPRPHDPPLLLRALARQERHTIIPHRYPFEEASSEPAAVPPLFTVDVVVDLSGWDRVKQTSAADQEQDQQDGHDSDGSASTASEHLSEDSDELLSGISFQPLPEVFKQVRPRSRPCCGVAAGVVS